MKKVHVIQHTHWDFEWYFTANESFVQLAYHMDEVFSALEEGVLDFYLLDGQMSIVDDYLTSFPDKKDRFISLVKAKKLYIGPWYTQTDELIVSGESIIRNLSLGMNLAKELGGTMKIGYLPDSFGQGKDMPKIYNGMGINQTVFWRGLPNELTEQREFIWESEDGSEVTALNIKNGYFVGVGLIYSDDAESLIATIDKDCTLMDIALPVGGDQRYVDFNLKDRIKQYNDSLRNLNYVLEESTYPAMMAELEKEKEQLPRVQGEFISSSVSKIHRSIYSSRYDHKYLNDKVERRMIYQLEPLMTMAMNMGIPYKKGLLDRIWKLLLRNHAHDSAGGCNSDATNQIILERFREADQLSYSAVDYLTRKIAESCGNIEENSILFFNTLPKTYTKIVDFEVSTTFKHFKIVKDDVVLPLQVNGTEKQYNGSIRRDESTYDPENYYYVHHASMEIELPGFSFAVCKIEQEKECNKDMITRSSDRKISNTYYAFEIVNGKCELVDKVKGKKYTDVLWVENSGDEGDTYDYSPPYQDDQYRLHFSDASIEKKSGPLAEVLLIEGTWQVAQDLQERYAKKRSQIIPYKLEIKLAKDSKQIELNFKIENRAKDHRMRLMVQTDVSAKHSYADTPFGIVKRPVIDPHIHNWQELGWREEPTAIYPMIHYVNTHNRNSSWTVFSKGMKEYEFVGENYQCIALTMYRSVGYLGRPDLLRRPGVASGNEFRYVPTPESQLQQTLHIKAAIQLDEEYHPALIMEDFQKYAVTIPFYQMQELNRFTTTLKYFVSNPLPFQIKQPAPWHVDSKKLVFSSLKATEDLQGFVLRVYNPSLTEVVHDEQLILHEHAAVGFLALNDEIVSPLEEKQIVDLGSFGPGEIKSIGIFPTRK